MQEQFKPIQIDLQKQQTGMGYVIEKTLIGAGWIQGSIQWSLSTTTPDEKRISTAYYNLIPPSEGE